MVALNRKSLGFENSDMVLHLGWNQGYTVTFVIRVGTELVALDVY